MIRAVFAAVLIGYLPGLLLLRSPIRGRDFRLRLPFEERVFWSVLLSLVISLAATLALAAFGRYSLPRLMVLNGIGSGLLFIICQGRLFGGAARPSPAALIPAGLVLLCAWQYFPPSEHVIGGKDPGTYINEGIQIAQRGSLSIDDPVVEDVPPPTRDLFFPSHNVPQYYGLRFMGFFVMDPETGTVLPQFPHLYPASVALGYGLNGLTGARQAVGVWAILGMLAVYFTGVRLGGRAMAAAAAALLAVNVLQVWFAREPSAEMLMQALLFAAMLAFSYSRQGQTLFFGTVAGGLLGLMLFLRYDIVVAIAAFAATAMLVRFTGERAGWPFFTALFATTAMGLWYLADFMRPYSALPFDYTNARGGWLLVAAGAAIFAAAAWLARVETLAARVRQWIPPAGGLLIVVLAIYAYFVRSPIDGRLSEADAFAFRNFTWYATRAGLAAAVAGFALIAWKRFWMAPAFVMTAGAYAVFFFYKMRIVPDHFWAGRRFVAVVLPAVTLSVSFLAFEGFKWLLRAAGRQPRSTAARVAAAVLAFAALSPLLVAFVKAAAPVRRHVEYAGLIPQLEALAAGVGDNDLLIVESRDASDVHVLGTPLAYIYARKVLVLNSARPDKAMLNLFVTWARARYDDVLFLGGGGTDLLTRQISAEALTSQRFQVPEYDSPRNGYPASVHHKEFDFSLYRLIDAPPGVSLSDLVIGRGDDLYVVRFHAKEVSSEGLPFRWSGRLSYVVLPAFGADTRRVTIWMSNGGRPATQAEPRVAVSLEEQVLGHVVPGDTPAAYTFDVPADVAAAVAASDQPARLLLRVATWRPADVFGGDDRRELGVMVNRVEIH